MWASATGHEAYEDVRGGIDGKRADQQRHLARDVTNGDAGVDPQADQQKFRQGVADSEQDRGPPIPGLMIESQRARGEPSDHDYHPEDEDHPMARGEWALQDEPRNRVAKGTIPEQ